MHLFSSLYTSLQLVCCLLPAARCLPSAACHPPPASADRPPHPGCASHHKQLLFATQYGYLLDVSHGDPTSHVLDKTSDVLLLVGGETCTDKIPRRSDSAHALEPSLRPAPAVGGRMDVLLVTHAHTGSDWRGLCDGAATRYRDDDVTCSPADGVWSRSILSYWAT
ncbi:hypothetical protein C8J57DRAFT_1501370 [Mycena rebaudengoi]|nr:hypothetical protein C8J57DRAFT_1534578 [Mycena rebaudengoi]KAJ7279910.1 hypothetical protein C8J57DRAFT_1501370 [Mycena rebaudengoi]